MHWAGLSNGCTTFGGDTLPLLSPVCMAGEHLVLPLQSISEVREPDADSTSDESEDEF